MDSSLVVPRIARFLVVGGLALAVPRAVAPPLVVIAVPEVQLEWHVESVDSDYGLRLEAGQGALMVLALPSSELGRLGVAVPAARGRMIVAIASGYRVTLAPGRAPGALVCISDDARRFARVARAEDCRGQVARL